VADGRHSVTAGADAIPTITCSVEGLGCLPTSFQDRHVRPLRHPSVLKNHEITRIKRQALEKFDLPGKIWSRTNVRLDRNWPALDFCTRSKESLQRCLVTSSSGLKCLPSLSLRRSLNAKAGNS